MRHKSQLPGSNSGLKAQIPMSRLKSQPQLKAQISALKLKSQLQGSYPSLEAQIPASNLISQPQSSNPSIMAQIIASRLKTQPWGSNESLKAQITASGLKPEPQGSIPSLMLQFQPRASKLALSIGHWPLQDRCPAHYPTSYYTHIRAMGTTKYLTLLRLFPCLAFLDSDPKGTKSCRTQGDFCLSSHPFVP